MTGQVHPLTIYLDENLSDHVAEALRLLSRKSFKEIDVRSTAEVFGRGMPDEQIIPQVGLAGDVLITKDLRIRKRPEQYDLCKQFGIGIFFLKMPAKEDKHWDMVKLLVTQWEDIVAMTQTQPRPFACELMPGRKMKVF